MKSRNFTLVVIGLFALTLMNCGAIFRSTRQTIRADSSPAGTQLAITPKGLPLGRPQGGQGWARLMQIGPGRDAIVTFTDGTLRGGQIVEVHSDELLLRVAGQDVTFARSDIVAVKVQRPSRALTGALVGFLIGGVGLTAILCSDCDLTAQGWVLGITLLGAPGGLVGALVGSQAGGDVEIIP